MARIKWEDRRYNGYFTMAGIGKQVAKILVPEMNLGQLAREVERFVSVPVVRVSKIGGVPHSVEEIYMSL